MSPDKKRPWSAVLVTLATLLATRSARAQFQDARVQAPTLAAPERGSITGQLASVAFGAADVSRGAFSLPSPLKLPSERGELGAPFAPTYAPDQGQTEWGMGWKNDMTITRWRARGEVTFDAGDGLVGPWGTMVRGDDGAFYPTGLRSLVRVVVAGDTLTARLPDGSTWTFGGESRDAGARGTYAWYLTSTRSARGLVSTYAYTKNASGRLFLSQVDYGDAVKGGPGYRASMAYELVARPILDYRSGELRLLDQRVNRVTVLARSAMSGVLVERWHETFNYQDETLGPAFYLARAQRTFAAGDAEPAVTYAYDLVSAFLPTVAARRAVKLDGLLAGQGIGGTLVNAARGALLDANQDGRPDLESAADNTLYSQTDDGYVPSALPPLSATANPYCRRAPEPGRIPRTLIELRPSDVEHSVVVTYDAPGGVTGFIACTRAGETRFTTTFDGNYKLGARARLADLDRDQLPDLVRLAGDGYDIARNTSTATAISFAPSKHGTFTQNTGNDALYVVDVNGDGIADLMALGDSAARVWYGRGNLVFETASVRIPALSQSGSPRGGLLTASVALADVNKDGLVDLLVGVTGSASLLLNTGTAFQSVAVPGLLAVGTATSRPYITDWVGSGDAEIAYVANGSAYSIALDRASSGLLAQADDGAGTVLRFTYERAHAAAGLRQRVSVLRRLEVQSTGLDTVTYEYGFDKPRWHSEGRFFLGFEGVTRRANLGSQALTYAHGDLAAGVLLSTVEHDDLAPAVEKVAYRGYDDAVSFGVSWKRPRTLGEGWRTTDPLKPIVSLDQTEYLAYQGVCPTTTRKTTRHGALTTESELLVPAAFTGALSCVSAHVTMSGAHQDPSLDFHYEARLARNDAGQLTELLVGDGHGGVLVDQDVAYTPDGKPSSVASPGRGVTVAEYDAGTRLLSRLTAPNGVVREVADRDPVTDDVRSLTVRHGSLAVTSSYRYDARERLAKTWSDAGNATEVRPETAYFYRDASGARPALVRMVSLVDGTFGIFSESAEIFSADGQTMAKASRIPEGWSLRDVTARDKNTREIRSYRSKPVADVTALDATSVLAGAALVAHTQDLLFGDAATSAELFHAGVERVVRSGLTLGGGDLTRADVENGAFTTLTSMDPARRVVSITDASGARTGYTYDALGRIREVRLADGATHRSAYDTLGRQSRIDRSGVASIAYGYDRETGLQTTTTFIGTDGVAARRVDYAYDGIGRVVRETHTDLATGRSQAFASYYDGATPESPGARNVSGLLTAVTGDRYTKHVVYRADGKVKSSRVDIAAWRSVEDAFTYDDDGTLHGTTRTVRDGAGAEVLRTATAVNRDAYGRTSGETLDGGAFVSFTYDVEGLPAWAQFAPSGAAHGEIATFQRDPLTRAQVGLNLHNASWSAAVSQRRNARGLVDSEDVQVGDVKRHRAYEYGAQGFLSQSVDESDKYSYGYDPTGLPARTTSTRAGAVEERTFARAGRALTAGTHHHTFDMLGRAVERDDVRLSYGPLGQVEKASKGDKSWSFLYDERAQRIAKLDAAGHVVAAYPGDSYLDETSMTTPVRAAGALVGILRQVVRPGAATESTFVAVPADSHGTVLADPDGTLRMPSPFGDRVAHPNVAAAIDYAAKGYDADLGVVRMGVRDYDPALGRFTTPDPLFLADPSRCLKSPKECNLYGYARSTPTQYTDPTGTCIEDACVAEGAAALGAGAFLVAATAMYYVSQPAGQRDIHRAWEEAKERLARGVDGIKEAFDSTTSSKTRTSEEAKPKAEPKAVEKAEDKRAESFVVRIQAQGGGVEKSVVFNQKTPVTVAQGLAGIEALKSQLKKGELRDRSQAFDKAAAWIADRPANGGAPPPGKSDFRNRGFSGNDARVDVEILRGVNFLQ